MHLNNAPVFKSWLHKPLIGGFDVAPELVSGNPPHTSSPACLAHATEDMISDQSIGKVPSVTAASDAM
jgi:hypothetical protein